MCTNNVYICKMEHRHSAGVKDHEVNKTQRLDRLPKQTAMQSNVSDLDVYLFILLSEAKMLLR